MKKLFLITVLLSFAFVANGCSDDDNTIKEQYTYEGYVENNFCGWTIYIFDEEENIGWWVEPINLDEEFKVNQISVRITFYYTGNEKQCGGFMGEVREIQILDIETI